MKKINLNSLLSEIVNYYIDKDIMVSGLKDDSRKVNPGDLFFACKGALVDGRNFINEAVQNGAVAILCEDAIPAKLSLSSNIPIIVVNDLRLKLGHLAARFYDYPAKKLTMIGVTGTNGKTTITQYLALTLSKLGISCAVIGTLGGGALGELSEATNTTPGPLVLQQLLSDFVASGIKAVAMEVSSQGLAQGRVNGIDFTVGVFTNLTREHLDCHHTMENYGAQKKKLFTDYKLKYAVINGDDDFGGKLIKELQRKVELYVYTTKENILNGHAIFAKETDFTRDGMAANLVTPWGNGLLQSKLLGEFNLSNLLAVIGVLGVLSLKLEEILTHIADLKPVAGRMEFYGGGSKPLIVIDYAHTPDALEKALLSLQNYGDGSLWCIFGCGGERDRGKRKLMGGIAERYSDHIILTNDNPRFEKQEQIVDDIIGGLLCPWAVEIEYDRAIAIQYAINNAQVGDIILIAGKGHEDYQIIGGDKLRYSDRDVVIKALGG